MDQKEPDAGSRREDLVDRATISEFVGEVEPGGEISLVVVLWSIGLSLLLLIGATIWWVTSH